MTTTTPRQILAMFIALDGMVQLATGGNTYGDILAAYEGRDLTNEEAAALTWVDGYAPSMEADAYEILAGLVYQKGNNSVAAIYFGDIRVTTDGHNLRAKGINNGQITTSVTSRADLTAAILREFLAIEEDLANA